MKKKFIIGIIVLLSLIITISFINHKKKINTIFVNTEKVKKGEIIYKVNAAGRIYAAKEVKISSKMMGRVINIPVKEGQEVKKGQLLLKIDDQEIRSKLNQAENNLSKFKENLKTIEKELKSFEKNYSRNKILFEQKMISQEQYENIENTFEIKRNELANIKSLIKDAEENLNIIKCNYEDTKIISPIDGKIIKINVEEGENVITGTMNNPGTVLMVIANLNGLVMEAEIDESDIANIKLNQEAEITVDAIPDTLIKGKVIEISDYPSQNLTSMDQNANYMVKIEILNPDKRLKSGMSANVDIIVNKKNNILYIPLQSIITKDEEEFKKELEEKKDSNKKLANISEEKNKEKINKSKKIDAVYIVENGKSKLKLVKTGIYDNYNIEIVDGLKEGEEVIIGPYKVLSNLKNGKKVSIINNNENSKKFRLL